MNYPDAIYISLGICFIAIAFLLEFKVIASERETHRLKQQLWELHLQMSRDPDPEHVSLLEANRTISRMTEERRELKKNIKKLTLALEVKKMNDSLESYED